MPQLPIFTQRLNTETLTEQQREQMAKQIAEQKQTGDYLSLDYDTRQRSIVVNKYRNRRQRYDLRMKLFAAIVNFKLAL